MLSESSRTLRNALRALRRWSSRTSLRSRTWRAAKVKWFSCVTSSPRPRLAVRWKSGYSNSRRTWLLQSTRHDRHLFCFVALHKRYPSMLYAIDWATGQPCDKSQRLRFGRLILITKEVLPSTDQSFETGFRPLSITMNCCWTVSIENWRRSTYAELICMTRHAHDGPWL